MSIQETINELQKTILECCDGDHIDNFARSLTVQEIIDTYIKILELEKEKTA